MVSWFKCQRHHHGKQNPPLDQFLPIQGENVGGLTSNDPKNLNPT